MKKERYSLTEAFKYVEIFSFTSFAVKKHAVCLIERGYRIMNTYSALTMRVTDPLNSTHSKVK